LGHSPLKAGTRVRIPYALPTAERLAAHTGFEPAVRPINAKRHATPPEAHNSEPNGMWRQSRICKPAGFTAPRQLPRRAALPRVPQSAPAVPPSPVAPYADVRLPASPRTPGAKPLR